MTAKDYELIAGVMRKNLDDTRDGTERSRIAYMIGHFADELQRDNPQFSRQTFLRSCGI